MFLKKMTNGFTGHSSIEQLRTALKEADAVFIGAGSGLSTSAGFEYAGERFEKYFSDFYHKYHFTDMYSGGFFAYPTEEERWAFWSRYIYINRYMDPPKPVYDRLFELVKGKDYFVLTTNVDHCFQKAGFDKNRMFYTQGDYGLFQCSEPCCQETWDNEDLIRAMVLDQGFAIDETGALQLPESGEIKSVISSALIPHCPHCGKPVSMNLRADDTFVEDAGWERHARLFNEFAARHETGKVLYLELGVGYNTPGIVKYNFWRMTAYNPDAVYACLNYGEAYAPREIAARSVAINRDIGDTLNRL